MLTSCLKNESIEDTNGMSAELSGNFTGTLWFENGERQDFYQLKIEPITENKIRVVFADGISHEVEITILNDYFYQNKPEEEIVLNYYAFNQNKRLFLNNLIAPATSFNGDKIE